MFRKNPEIRTVLNAAVFFAVSAAFTFSAGSERVEKKVVVTDGPRMTLVAKPAFSVLKAGEKQTAWMRVGLTGFQLKSETDRAPMNVAIVLDRSGSMQGEKIRQARDAAISALELLKPDDIVSVIAYDTEVSVLVPATKLTDREQVAAAIRNIRAGGNTALFGGVSKGAAEVRKFQDERHVNRIVLLSDGLANVGPSSPGELGSLGISLKKENISVTTLGLGLGYNEDLMVKLAGLSGGNHQFIEDASELTGIFRREFDEALSIVAQEVDMTVTIPETLRPVRVLGNAADINGQQVVTRLAQVYSNQQKYVVVEVEIPETLASGTTDGKVSNCLLAEISVRYRNMVTQQIESLSGSVSVTFSDNDTAVKAGMDHAIMAEVVALIASEQNKLATDLLDQGDILGCRELLKKNADFLNSNSRNLKSESLLRYAETNEAQLKQLEGVTTNSAPGAVRFRKSARDYQIKVDQQAPSAVPESAVSGESPK